MRLGHRLLPTVVLSVFAIMLAGCMSPEERLAAQNARNDQQCLSYGAQKGSDVYVSCRTQLSTARTTASAITAESTDFLKFGSWLGFENCHWIEISDEIGRSARRRLSAEGVREA
jgi:hypothetical protein